MKMMVMMDESQAALHFLYLHSNMRLEKVVLQI